MFLIDIFFGFNVEVKWIIDKYHKYTSNLQKTQRNKIFAFVHF